MQKIIQQRGGCINKAWSKDEFHVHKPTSEEEYMNLFSLAHEISDYVHEMGVSIEGSPYLPLFELVAQYMYEWENIH